MTQTQKNLLVEQPKPLFSFQFQETQDQGGQTPSSERQLLRVHHIYRINLSINHIYLRNWAVLTSPRKVLLTSYVKGA